MVIFIQICFLQEIKDFLNSSDEDIDHEVEETIEDDESLSAAIALEVSIYLKTLYQKSSMKI